MDPDPLRVGIVVVGAEGGFIGVGGHCSLGLLNKDKIFFLIKALLLAFAQEKRYFSYL